MPVFKYYDKTLVCILLYFKNRACFLRETRYTISDTNVYNDYCNYTWSIRNCSE